MDTTQLLAVVLVLALAGLCASERASVGVSIVSLDATQKTVDPNIQYEAFPNQLNCAITGQRPARVCHKALCHWRIISFLT
jgi:hypothetical protein